MTRPTPDMPDFAGIRASFMPQGLVARKLRKTLSFLFAGVVIILLTVSAFAQTADEPFPEGVVPPPLNVISKQERSDLDAETKMKDRTKLALEFMDIRLKRSEEAASKEEYQVSLDELGRFQALIRDTFRFLKKNESEKGSFKNFKKFEMTLRDFIPRLELLRRELPFKYGYHVRRMIIFVADARMNALEPFFDDTVIPEGGSR